MNVAVVEGGEIKAGSISGRDRGRARRLGRLRRITPTVEDLAGDTVGL